MKMTALISEMSREISSIARKRERALGNLMRGVRWPIYRWHNTPIGESTMQLRYEDPRDSAATRNQYGVYRWCVNTQTRTVLPYNWLLCRSQVAQAEESRPSYKGSIPPISELLRRRDAQREWIRHNCIILRDAVCDISLVERICDSLVYEARSGFQS